jgi:hypothetical protein
MKSLTYIDSRTLEYKRGRNTYTFYLNEEQNINSISLNDVISWITEPNSRTPVYLTSVNNVTELQSLHLTGITVTYKNDGYYKTLSFRDNNTGEFGFLQEPELKLTDLLTMSENEIRQILNDSRSPNNGT